MASNESFKQAIKAYLDKRAEEDSLFAPKYANEKKNIDECCSYIMGEARKRGNAVAISDEEIYGMAVHYYDEDDIKINRLPAGEKTSVSSSAKPVELTEEDKKAARDRAIARLAEEQYQTLRKKNIRKKADDNEPVLIMKPRTKLEKRVTGLSGKLSAVTEVQKEWAKEHIFTHEAYRCKDELWCSECGGTWIDTSNSELGTTLLGDTTECPYCHHKLDVKISRKRKVEEEKYMSILQTAGEFQIIRHILCCKYVRKRNFDLNSRQDYIHYTFFEVVQEWITVEGKRTIMAKPMNMGGNGWIYSEPLSIKGEYGSYSYNYRGDLYAIWGWIYPRKKLIPELRKRGIGKRFPDVPPSKLVRDLLKGGNDAELCIKTGQTDMLKHMYKTGYYQLRYKPSFNICNRNRYIIRDASMWNDYISLLSYFHKDLHNAKYVCPKNLKAEHDRLLRKKNEIEARQRRERDRIKAIQKEKQLKEDIASFYNRMERFFGMEIKGDGIVIRPLESVTQFYKEGKAMHHCVYQQVLQTQ